MVAIVPVPLGLATRRYDHREGWPVEQVRRFAADEEANRVEDKLVNC